MHSKWLYSTVKFACLSTNAMLTKHFTSKFNCFPHNEKTLVFHVFINFMHSLTILLPSGHMIYPKIQSIAKWWHVTNLDLIETFFENMYMTKIQSTVYIHDQNPIHVIGCMLHVHEGSKILWHLKCHIHNQIFIWLHAS